MNSFFQLFAFVFFLSTVLLKIDGLLYAQGSGDDSQVASNPNHSNSKVESKPMKYETGDVTIDLQHESDRLKKLSEMNSKKLTNLFINRGKTEEWKKIQTIFSQANVAYLRGDYTESRRLFHQGLEELDTNADSFNKEYKTHFNRFTEELNQKLEKVRDESSEGERQDLLDHLESRGKEAGVFFRQALFLERSGKPILALSYHQLSIRELLHGLIRANKELESIFQENPEANKDKAQTSQEVKKYLSADYLEKESLKILDDSMNLNHLEENKKREEERGRIQRYIDTKQSSTTKQQPTKKSNQDVDQDSNKDSDKKDEVKSSGEP